MLATMASACQHTAFCALNEWKCLSDMQGQKRRKRNGGGKVGNLIAGCTVIQEVRNVSDKQIFDLLSGS